MKKLRKSISILLCFLMVFSVCFVSLDMKTSALYKRHGYINDEGVNIRSGAGTGNESLGELANNTEVLIDGVGFDNNGVRWYRITAYTSSGEISGYVHSNYVTVTGSDKSYPAVVNKTTTVRSAPGTWNSAVTQITAGTSVTVIGSEDDADGDMWYHATFENNGAVNTGYIYETCIDLMPEYKEDPEFEKHLNQEGFPESYKPYLRNLHALYPEWEFYADQLELTWAQAVEGENGIGVSLVSPSSSAAWKSMAEGAYNWQTGKWETFDSGGWVQAADSVVQYYLDPRNFLTSSGVFQFIDMHYNPEFNTKEQVEKALKGTFMEGEFPEDTYETYADVLVKAAEESGVSPISLASMIVVEQGSSGKGKSISGTYTGYEGYYNHYNIRAYRSGSYNAVQYGLLYAKGGDGTITEFYRPWNTRAKSIIGGAVWYAKKYMKKGQYTLYYKKFKVSQEPYFGHQYMTNVQAAASEASKTADGYKGIMDEALKFYIPVYKDMPQTAAPYPTKVGNNNCYLSDLSVNSYKFTPSFYKYTNEYEFVVPANESSVVITPVASDSGATVTGGGVVNLKYGNNKIDIKVKSSSGVENVYTLYIYREISQDAEFEFDASAYTFEGNYVMGIKAGTSAQAVITNFNIVGGSARITNPDGSEATVAGTGDIIELIDNKGNLKYTYYLVVENDLNGDGNFSLVDISWMQRHLVYIQELTGASAIAADISGDGRLSLVDLSRMQRKLLNLE